MDKWTRWNTRDLVEGVTWVKSHRTLNGSEDEKTLRDVKGNAAADRLAG